MGKSNTSNNYTEFFYKAFRNVLLISIPLVIISALVLSLPHSSASTDQIEFSLSVSCTMSSMVNTAHTKEITNGTYHTNVGKTTITTLCNDGNGYTVYATGYSNNEVGNNKLINTANSQYSIDTGLATSGLTSAWAMKLNNLENDPSFTPPIIESAYDDTYGLVPNNWTKVASRSSGTTDMNLGSSFTTTYSIYTSSSQFAGTYRGQVKYALLHPYSDIISFNNLDQAFAFYEKEKVNIPGVGSYYTMQGMDSDICNKVISTGENTATQLLDIRDNKLYWVAKLADNNCWMTQNLDLDLSSSVALTSDDTNISTDTSLYVQSSSDGPYALDSGYAINTINNRTVVSWTPERSTYTSTSAPGTENWAGDTGDNSTSGYYHPYSWNRVKNNNGDPVYPDNTVTEAVAGSHAQSGNYYNYSAAVASNDSLQTSAERLPKNSICPKGWRLPVKDEYNTLYNAYKTAENHNDAFGLMANPLRFVRTGAVNGNGSLINSGNTGFYLINRLGGNPLLYFRMSFTDYGVTPSSYNDRYYGFSVRCMASAS